MIPHVKTNNDTITLQLSTGIKIISKNSFNYKQICELLETGTEEDILPLLEYPDTPEGVYYLSKTNNELMVLHYDNDGTQKSYCITSSLNYVYNPDNFLGVYTSINNIIADYPEYFL